MSNPYETLGLGKDATITQIKKAYHKSALKWHPDKNPPDKKEKAESKFKEISKAYEVLSDPDKKKKYDQFGIIDNTAGSANDSQGQSSFDPFNIFNVFMNGMSSFGRQGMNAIFKRKTKDAVKPFHLTLNIAYTGTVKKFGLTRKIICKGCEGKGALDTKTCNECQGTGQKTHIQRTGPWIQQRVVQCTSCQGKGHISTKDCEECKGAKVIPDTQVLEVIIPAGVEHGRKIIVKGQSDEYPGYITGDLIFVVQIKSHPEFVRRSKNDLQLVKWITLKEALCGLSFVLQHLDGHELSVQTSSIIKPNDCKKISDEGMWYKDSNNEIIKGHLYIKFKIKFPEDLEINKDKIKKLLP